MRSLPRLATACTCLLAALPASPQQEVAAPAPATVATVLLCGRVVTWEGAPIAGAAVAFAAAANMTTAELLDHPTSRTGDDGRFQLAVPSTASPDPPWALLLVASKGKAAVARSPHWQMAKVPPGTPTDKSVRAPETDMGDVVLPDGVRLFGRVRDEDGKPLFAARVLARDLLESSHVLQGPRLDCLCSAVTDEHGIFQLPATLAQAVTLDVALAGFHRYSLEPVSAGTPLEITLTRSGTIAGRVLDAEGRGVAGASVAAAYERRGPVETARTEADGSFRLPLEYAARYRLHASLRTDPDTPRAAVLEARSDVLAGARSNLELELGPAPKTGAVEELPLRVVAARSRQEVVEFRAAAVWEEYANRNASYLEYRFQYAMQQARPGKDGRALVPGPARNNATTGAVRVLASGYAPATKADVEWKDAEAGKERAELQVELVPEATVAGAVVDEGSGAPVAGAMVWATPRFDPGLGTYSDRNGDKPPPDAVAAGADGAFVLRQLGEGHWQLRVQHPERPAVPPESFDLAAEEQKNGVVLRLPAGATVAGRITGMPLPQGSRVFLHPLPKMMFGSNNNYTRYSSGENIPDTAVELGPDGAFAVSGVKLDNFMLVLVLPSPPRCGGSLGVPLEPFRVRAAGIRRDFDVGEDRPGGITGKVSFPAASLPFDRLVVVAQMVADDQNNMVFGGNISFPGPRSFVGPDARFAIRVGPGSYRLQLVDLATGIQLGSGADVVKVKASETAARTLEAPLSEVQVRLEPETKDKPAALVDRVEVRFQPKAANQNRVVMNNDNYDAGVGVPLPPGASEVALALPAGSAIFLLRNNLSQLRVDDNRWNMEPLGRQEFEVTAPGPGASAKLDCAIKVGPPPEIPPPDPKKDKDADAGK